jgi:hypothetical protein
MNQFFSFFVIVVFITTGCATIRESQIETDLKAAHKQVDTALSAINLARVSKAKNNLSYKGVRIYVSPEALAVDNIGWLEQIKEKLNSEQGKQLVKNPSELLVVEMEIGTTTEEKGGVKIKPLMLHLIRIVENQKKIAKYFPGILFSGDFELIVDRNVSYDLISKVLYTAGLAQLLKPHIRVQAPHGTGHLDVSTPKYCVTVSDKPSVGIECLSPYLEVTNHGILVRASRQHVGDDCFYSQLSSPDLDVAFAVDEPKTKEPEKKEPVVDWNGRIIISPSKTCPTILKTNTGHDKPALMKFLKKVAKAKKTCQLAVISPLPKIGWQEVAEVFSVVSLEAGFGRSMLSLLLLEEEDCSQAVTLETLAAPDSPLQPKSVKDN